MLPLRDETPALLFDALPVAVASSESSSSETCTSPRWSVAVANTPISKLGASSPLTCTNGCASSRAKPGEHVVDALRHNSDALPSLAFAQSWNVYSVTARSRVTVIEPAQHDSSDVSSSAAAVHSSASVSDDGRVELGRERE